ncbi:MAG: NfeD family protein [Oscillospiraceae bacterium]|nr:NfeD family protein [Oscillospiraceae bacterium]
MITGIGASPWVWWLGVLVICLIVEGAVPGLVSIWFAFGALVALLISLLNAPLWLQVTAFIVVSLAALFLTRPLVKKYVNGRTQPTNADMLIGREAIVTEDIDNVLGTGAVKASGREWTARSESDNTGYRKGTMVHVVRIEGVKLIVKE